MIEFARRAYDDVLRHATEVDSREVCGVLAGEYGAATSTVTEIRRAENVAGRPRVRYAIDPEEQLAIIESVEDDGLEVVGFYHSHPTGPPRPSGTDVDRATWPDYTYAICALDGYPYLGAWRWRGNEERFEQEVLAVTG